MHQHTDSIETLMAENRVMLQQHSRACGRVPCPAAVLCDTCLVYVKELKLDNFDFDLHGMQVHLEKLSGEISKTLEKIASREKYINSQVCLLHTHTHTCTHTHSPLHSVIPFSLF